MSRYDKLTVAEIRAEFKARGIPATGLTRKQQLIDRLLEVDAEAKADNEVKTTEDTVPAANQPVLLQDNAGQAEEFVEQAHALRVPTEEEHGSEAMVNKGNISQEAIVAQKEPGTTEMLEPAVKASAQPHDSVLQSTQDASLVATEPKQTIEEPVEEAGVPTAVTPQPATTELAESEDNRKRKRRSLTPDVQEEEVAQKRRRSSGTADGTAAQAQETKSDSVNAKEEETVLKAQADPPVTRVEETDDNEDEDKDQGRPSNREDITMEHEVLNPSSTTREPQLELRKDIRHRDSPPPSIAAVDGVKDDSPHERYVTPSLHPATSALYIRNLKRPLQPHAFEAHAETLAQQPTSPSNTASITAFHLDALRTHAFILFNSVAAAARVRAALHESIWPSEPTREPLWVDFVPEESVEDWIELERTSGSGARGAGAKRWEVVYEDGWARFQEAGNTIQPPSGPRASFTQQSGAPPPRIPTPEVQHVAEAAKPAPFLALDTLFKSTVAKPKLYFLPVAANLADKRLDEFDSRTTRRGEIPPGGSGYRDSRRYTFEDGGLVDGGPEFGLRAERAGGRGGRRGGRRGR